MYQAPVQDILFMLRATGGLDGLINDGLFPDLDADLAEAILNEAGRFASEEIAPINSLGDRTGAKLQGNDVILPEEWKKVYSAMQEGGWAGLSAPSEHGGQAMPLAIAMAVQEMWNAASMAFGIGTVLTTGAIEALNAHGADELKAKFLPRMISGEWTGTMNLTEPQAGSDLSTLRTRAEPQGDGSYKIFGQKIFITYGEHQLTENIVHLVLARLPDAPEGTKGISLFLVPKFMVGDDGSLGARNDVYCTGIEHKLGIHASPTCTMSFGENGGAVGYLIGEENKGLRAMFTMMNNARLAVGVQGVAIAERAYQQAFFFAKERKQGKIKGVEGDAAIIHHPDVKRMLLLMQGHTFAARAICLACAHAIDRSHHDKDEAARAIWAERANLLTPIAKAYSTDIGVEVASLGVQVHGGMGYVEETGAAQHLRDARIAPIYEGTNGIQALDLVFRKIGQSEGEAIRTLIADIRQIAQEGEETSYKTISRSVREAADDLEEASLYLMHTLTHEPEIGQAVAVPYLRLVAVTVGGAFLLRAALRPDADARYGAIARFYAAHVMSETASLRRIVEGGAESVLNSRLGE